MFAILVHVAENGADPRESPERLLPGRFGSIASVITTDVASRPDQCPVKRTVDLKSIITEAVDGRSNTIEQHNMSRATLVPQFSHAAVARRPKHRSS